MSSLKTKDIVHGFEVKKIQDLSFIKARSYELEHIKTGAKYLHIETDDQNNTFSVAFKTIPDDSTGIAHILEHTVLCGSEKFPVKDPFFSMIKRSVNSFMNAMTSSDWTMYPFSGPNETDFYNLMDVYLDAVFFPKIAEISFLQEGHRFEFENPTDPASKLKITGIVYNEMKGAMSSPDAMLYQHVDTALFPTTTYSKNSGGDPACIPDLTYEQFVNFHKRFYHPSNSFLYSYGNFSLEKHLKKVNEEYLCKFDKIDPKTEVGLEKRSGIPKTQTHPYPLDKEEDDGNKNYVAVSWPLTETKDVKELMIVQIIENLLIGNDAAPLKKALIDSKKGKSLYNYSGLDVDKIQTQFTVGLQGVSNQNIDDIEGLIINELCKIVQDGIPKEALEASVHQLEFQTKEIIDSYGPYGLSLLVIKIISPWIHGGQISSILDLNVNLDEVKVMLEKPNFIENKIKQYFIDNPDRVAIKMTPDGNIKRIEQENLDNKLQGIKEKLSDSEKSHIVNKYNELKSHQEQEEDLSCLPIISLDDLDKNVKKVTPEPTVENIDSAIIHCYEQETNDITNVKLNFNISGIDHSEVKYLELLSGLLTKTGTKNYDHDELSKKIELKTGDLTSSLAIRTQISGEDSASTFMHISGKALDRNLNEMFSIFKEIVTNWSAKDIERVRSLLQQLEASTSSQIANSGSSYAMKYSTRSYSKSLKYEEETGGITFYKFIKELIELSDEDLKKIIIKLEQISQKIFANDNLTAFIVGKKSGIEKSKTAINELVKSLNKSENFLKSYSNHIDKNEEATKENCAWTTTTSVSYVVKSFQAPKIGNKESSTLMVLSKLISRDYLHTEIREKGGAYGGYSVYNWVNGLFSLVSYRDPNITKTKSVYDNIMSFFDNEITDEALQQAKIQSISALDKPKSPAEECISEYVNSNLYSIDQSKLQDFKSNIFDVTKNDLINATKKYLNMDSDFIVVTSKDQLEKDMPENIEIKTIK